LGRYLAFAGSLQQIVFNPGFSVENHITISFAKVWLNKVAIDIFNGNI